MNARDRPAFIFYSTTHEYLLMFFLFSRVLFLVLLNLNMTQIHLVSLTIVKAKPDRWMNGDNAIKIQALNMNQPAVQLQPRLGSSMYLSNIGCLALIKPCCSSILFSFALCVSMGEKINVDKREKQRGERWLHPLAIYSYTVSRSKEMLLIIRINLSQVSL